MRLIHPLIILRILSNILFAETVSYLFCLPVAFIYREPANPFLLSAAITIVLSVIFFFISRKAEIKDISTRDGYLAVTLSWIVFSLMGTLPYLISHTIPNFIDAFFESTSGFSTTGSTVLTNVEILPFSILFWRSLTHWIGGLGIILLVIIILPALGVSGYQIFSLESSLREKIRPRTNAIGFIVILTYLGLTVVQILLLSLGDMNLFDSICHTFGTVSTGGFSTKNDNLAHFSSYSQYIVMLFMFLAGISQLVYYYLIRLNFRKVRQNEELWFYIAVATIAGAIATIVLLVNTSETFETAFRQGFFQVISVLTCTGYTSTDYFLWPATGMLLLFILMFAGGSTGSTSGGIKMARHLIVLKNIKNVFVKLNHPQAVSLIKLNDKVVSENINISILSFVALYLFMFLIGSIFLLANGSDAITSASAVASCMAGIGPALGSVDLHTHYSGLPEASKIALTLLMILGRLEIMTIFALFTRTYWKK